MSAQNPVHWFEIYVTDMDRAKKFYETVLLTTLTEMPAPEGAGGGLMFGFPYLENGPGSSGALVKHDMGTPSSSGSCLYFGCADCAVELGRVEAAGGQVNVPKFSIGEYGFCGLASDTEGNTIGFYSME